MYRLADLLTASFDSRLDFRCVVPVLRHLLFVMKRAACSLLTIDIVVPEWKNE